MSALWPTPAEVTMLRFVIAFPSWGSRLATAAGLFLGGTALWTVLPLPWALGGLFAILAGHLALWARRQTNAPGGGTPVHEEVWAPVEENWLERLMAHEKRGERWDVTPWEISNRVGCATLVGVLALSLGLAVGAGVLLGGEALGRFLIALPTLFVPLWLSGMRSTWNPSELRKKGEALQTACLAVAPRLGSELEIVPLLALRDGKRGKYPVDARVMVRPTRDDGSGFLGVQLQVALNSVQGTDYPYLYAVVLGKPPCDPAAGAGSVRSKSAQLVTEKGSSEGVKFLVIRQHADKNGGWHTSAREIEAIVTVALTQARTVWRAAGGEVAG